MNLLSRIFNTDNKSYLEAKQGLTKIMEKLGGLSELYPDVTASEIIFIKDQWSTLPNTLGAGVQVLGVEMKKDLTVLLSKYQPHGFQHPHLHSDMFEFNKVLRGSVHNRETGITYKKGESFIIGIGEKHYISAGEESLVYSVLSPDETKLVAPKPQSKVMRQLMASVQA